MPDAPAETKVCSKCGGAMEEGEFFTATKGLGLISFGFPPVIRWAKSVAKLAYKGQMVQVFACPQCGFLESYLESK